MKPIIITNRNDGAKILLQILRPLKAYYSPGHAWLHLGNTGVHYGEKASRMEGFSRILWGLGPLWAGEKGLTKEVNDEAQEWLLWYLTGIINGTDPNHPEYWGEVADYDQKMVEMAALVTAISLVPKKLWEPLTKDQKENLYHYLNQINRQKVHPNNWRYFRILVNMVFRLLGLPWSKECMKEDRGIIESCYTGDGWYYDGNSGQVDYYIPFAMQYYSLIYAGMMENCPGLEKEEQTYLNTLKTRAAAFSKDFIYWFSADGNEIPFGRSLAYRFAHSAFFGALAFANGGAGLKEKEPGYGTMRSLVLKNLETWLSRPIFDHAGILTIGYGYPNLFMSERYNGPGSPYWSLKTFLILALPDSHPFWVEKEESWEWEVKKFLPHPHMLITHEENSHVLAYTAGQTCRNHGHCPEKYEKFVYSNQFGFSVSREPGLKEGAFDCTLAASPAGENNYRMRYGTEASLVSENAVKVTYHLMKGVWVDSVIIPCGSWHIRVHKIVNEVPVDIADGGFCVEAEVCFAVHKGAASGKYTPDQIEETENGIFAAVNGAVSGAVSLSGAIPQLVECFPNTNLFYNLTVLPTLVQTLLPGTHLVVSCIFGDRSEEAGEKKKWLPKVTMQGEEIRVETKWGAIRETFLSADNSRKERGES